MTECRVLIVSPPTVDIVEVRGGAVKKPGGPALYAGYAARTLGCRVYAIGPVGYDTLWTAAVESRLGVTRLGYLTASQGYVYHHKYGVRGKRVSRILGRPEPLDPVRVLEALGRGVYTVVLLSPLHGEDSGCLASYIYSNTGSITAVDLQGYYRAYAQSWSPPTARIASLAHLSSDDASQPPYKPLAGLIIYTRGDKGGEVLGPQGVSPIPPPPRLVEDPTGAGDVFTMVYSIMIARGETPSSAAEQAANTTPEILESIMQEIAGLPALF
ncbi:ribokinase-like domain-containing protein [Aeropyrum camini]|uniref:Ribokinase-like domain-containing protein n=1 Tax=Aeropyrum camini SY1 = JCM 12091 TaxID=1198449 RepID=U3TC86_9CREN|nr:ribokinase-like domain-containing protein [Aeropyrum camini]BAN89630.1 ribokinase-like domain-containing protein [Aeropyrum camini SY1 = JCM 12091]